MPDRNKKKKVDKPKKKEKPAYNTVKTVMVRICNEDEDDSLSSFENSDDDQSTDSANEISIFNESLIESIIRTTAGRIADVGISRVPSGRSRRLSFHPPPALLKKSESFDVPRRHPTKFPHRDISFTSIARALSTTLPEDVAIFASVPTLCLLDPDDMDTYCTRLAPNASDSSLNDSPAALLCRRRRKKTVQLLSESKVQNESTNHLDRNHSMSHREPGKFSHKASSISMYSAKTGHRETASKSNVSIAKEPPLIISLSAGGTIRQNIERSVTSSTQLPRVSVENTNQIPKAQRKNSKKSEPFLERIQTPKGWNTVEISIAETSPSVPLLVDFPSQIHILKPPPIYSFGEPLPAPFKNKIIAKLPIKRRVQLPPLQKDRQPPCPASASSLTLWIGIKQTSLDKTIEQALHILRNLTLESEGETVVKMVERKMQRLLLPPVGLKDSSSPAWNGKKLA